MRHHPRFLSRLPASLVTTLAGPLLLGGAILACSDDPQSSARDQAGREEQRFSTGLSGEPVHEDITAEALAFLRPEIVAALQAANVSVDAAFVLDNAHHFDDCNFSGGADVIRSLQTFAVAALDPSTALTGDAAALVAFGQWLHTAQDFYAHSNWVELGGQTLADDTLTAWAVWSPYETLPGSGFRLVQGRPPKSTSVTRQSDAPYPQDAVVRVKSSKQRSPGVMSGSVDYEPGDFCPPSVEMSHADLNKDHSATPGREAQFAVAKSLAVQQTHHEWCRLVAMTRVAWGDAGVAHLMTWAADPVAASCP